jgi:tRNA modification GTPase
MIYDTIAAIATAPGIGAIHVIRLSGPNAIEMAASLFTGANLRQSESHKVHYGRIVHQGEILDEVLLTVFRAPKTFTAEDVVEISAHGGTYVATRILEALVAVGARLAEPGEFTRRAYLNGRIDLTQAEAIQDIIAAKSSSQLSIAQSALSGTLRKQIESMQSDLLDTIAAIEVHIDYPEYDDAETVTTNLALDKATLLKATIDQAIETAATGTILREGIRTVIVGTPNVGKSSLLNSLLKEDKAIVTDISGTTRDLIEGEFRLGSLLLRLIDTAGIRETSDTVEKIGIERSKKAMSEADLILLVLDRSRQLTQDDEALLAMTKGKKRILVGNKSDLDIRLELENETIVPISARHGIGLDKLEAAVKETFLMPKKEEAGRLFANVRHVGKLREASAALGEAIAAAQAKMPVDMVEIDLKHAWSALGAITGEQATDDLIEALFAKFCLGK